MTQPSPYLSAKTAPTVFISEIDCAESATITAASRPAWYSSCVYRAPIVSPVVPSDDPDPAVGAPPAYQSFIPALLNRQQMIALAAESVLTGERIPAILGLDCHSATTRSRAQANPAPALIKGMR